MTDISRLLAAVPSGGFGSALDWLRLDAELGFTAPSDYKSIIDTYGPGVFGRFLWVMLPQSEMQRLDIASQISIQRNTLRELAEFEEVPYDVESLIPCAGTNNGDTIFWHTDGLADSSRWTVVIGSGRDPQWDEYEGNLLNFLIDVFSGEYQCPVFPEGFPDEGNRSFVPLSQLSG